MRNDSVSIAKGIGIILMVLAHAGCPDFAWRYIYMFHMPLFFIMSGYCFNIKYTDNKKNFILKRIKGLYVPYIKYGLIFLLLHNVFFVIGIYNDECGFRGATSVQYTLMDCLKRGISIVTRMSDAEQLLGGYWFLKELFFASILSLFIISYVKKLRLACLVLLGLVVITCLYPELHVPYLGLGSRTVLATFFFIVGYLIKNFQVRNTFIQAVVVAILIGIMSVYMPMAMTSYTAITVVPYCCCAIGGTLMVIYISERLLSVKIGGGKIKQCLIYIGNNTMPILTWHLLSFKLVALLLIAIYDLQSNYLGYFPVIPNNPDTYSYYTSFWVFYSIVGVTLPILGCLVYDKLKNV